MYLVHYLLKRNISIAMVKANHAHHPPPPSRGGGGHNRGSNFYMWMYRKKSLKSSHEALGQNSAKVPDIE